MPEPTHPVIDAAERFRAAALARERATANDLVRTYARIWQRLQDEVKVIESLPIATGTNAARLRAVKSLSAQVEQQVSQWAVYADQTISDAALREIRFGLGDSSRLVQAYFQNPRAQAALAARFDQLVPEQVETMLGFLADDSPLHDALVNKLGPELAKRMGDALSEGIGLGYNPRQIAALARAEFGVGLQWALTTSRTAQVWSYREASRQNYMANADVVISWEWMASLGPRCCLSCVNMHGTKHDVTEVLNDHHNGRCVALPIVPLASKLGVKQPQLEDGEEWFRRQPVGVQKSMMGPSKWHAWQDGAIEFSDLTHKHDDPVYGEMLTEASLVSLLGENAKAYYKVHP